MFFLRSQYIYIYIYIYERSVGTPTHELCFLKSSTQSPSCTHTPGSLMIRNTILSLAVGFSVTILKAYRMVTRRAWLIYHTYTYINYIPIEETM